jgi:hypothetical protein
MEPSLRGSPATGPPIAVSRMGLGSIPRRGSGRAGTKIAPQFYYTVGGDFLDVGVTEEDLR